jgi:Xaa-Pro aminopeptidase
MRLSFVFPALLVCAAQAADPSVWKTAPPPPVSWERDRVADLAARRQAMAEQLGEKAVLILLAAEPRNYAGDVDWPYRQENNFFYLTGLTQPGAALVMLPGASAIREILFLPPSNPAQENWTGHLLTAEEGRRISGIREIWDVRQLNSFLSSLLGIPDFRVVQTPPGGRPATTPLGPVPVDVAAEFRPVIAAVSNGDSEVCLISRGPRAEYGREIDMASKLESAGLKVKDATPVFTSLRRIKSRREIDILRHALDITAEAFQRAYAVALPGAWEYEVQAQFEFTYIRRNAHWGYPPIVAAGVNATTLHYETNKDRIQPGDLLLMDDAAEFDGYSVDVTRTIPVSGKFTREQAEIYRLVWDAQQAAFRKALPGHAITGGADSLNGAVAEVFKKGLFKLGLMTDPESDQQMRIWFNHGVSHGIGLNVHDPGGRELAPGMVVTVEPGIYIRPDALDHLPKTPENEKFIAAVRPAFEKYKGIGVRIEDDVLITGGAPEVISSAIPSRLEEVEASIAQLRKAAKSAPMP